MLSHTLKRSSFFTLEGIQSFLTDQNISKAYDLNHIQIFRTINFFDLCNYSLLDLLAREWFVLFERLSSVNELSVIPSLMEGLAVGRIYFGKVVHLFADQGILIGHSRALPLSSKVSIARIRRNLIEKRAADFARDFWLFDSDVFNLYHELCYGNLAAT